MATKRKGKQKGRVVSVDMKGVDVKRVLPEDDYLVAVEEVTEKVGESSGKAYLEWKLRVVEGEYEGVTLYHKTSLQPHALFNLKGTLIALGIPVPNNTIDLNLDKMVGLKMGASVEKGTYDGKPKNDIVEVFPWDASEEEDELEVEEPDEDENEDEDEDEEIDLESLNLGQLIELAKEQEVDLSGLSKKDLKKVGKVRAAIAEALSEE